MKMFQKSLLRGIITILCIDIFFQLTKHDSLISFINPEMSSSSVTYWVYPLAFILGSILAGSLVCFYSHFSIISIGLLLIGLIHGGYGLISTLDSFVFLRFIHGFLTASSLTVVFTWYSFLMEKEKLRYQLGRLLLPLPISGLLLLSLYHNFHTIVKAHWSIFTFLFSYIFLSIFSLFLINYLQGIAEKTVALSIKELKSSISTSGLKYYSLAAITSTFILGTLSISTFEISLVAYGALFFSMTLALIIKLGSIGDLIGDMKGVLMALLMMPFSLSLLPILQQSNLILIPMLILGLSLGILGCSIYGAIEMGFAASTKGLIIGFLHSISLISYIGGWWMSSVTILHDFSPFMVDSLIIIGISILYIRKIHQPMENPINF